MSKPYLTLMKVRDYEIDALNGVNNACYLNYLEFARFEYLRNELGWDLDAIAHDGYGFVLTELDIKFMRSLVSGDDFEVQTEMTRLSKTNFEFSQVIYRLPSTKNPVKKKMASSKIYSTVINTKTNKIDVSEKIEELLSGRFPLPV